MKKIVYISLLAVLLSACSTPKIAYFQGLRTETPEEILNPMDIRIRPEDKLQILVISKDPMLMSLFNMPVAQRTMGFSTSNSISGGSGGGTAGHIVRGDGTIDFPVLGDLYVAGMTREELARFIKHELISKNLVNDPVVTVDFLNMSVTVLGEVGHAGRINIDKEHLTLLDVLAMAGDITPYGKRENVLVQRLEKGKNVLYKVDVTKGKELYASPVYYVQQNDVIYVEPNEVKVRQATVMGNTTRTPTFWLSLVSSVLSLTMTIIAFSKLK